MSFYTLAFFGMGSLGSLLADCWAGTLGTSAAFLACGMVSVTEALVFVAPLLGFHQPSPIYGGLAS